MRIIGGKAAGLRLTPPAHLPVRPTTDLAKEALFNILTNRIDFQGAICLDLFAGTGNVSFEMASRGANQVLSVDQHGKCLHYIKQTAQKIDFRAIRTQRMDVFRFIQSANDSFDFVFADPPYDLGQLPQLPKLILEQGLVKPAGWLVIEHPSRRKLIDHQGWVETRNYGNCAFSFYQPIHLAD